MKRRPVRFCEGCGHVMDEFRPGGGPDRWVEARLYFATYGVTWDDLTLIHDFCPPCVQVLNCVPHSAAAPEMEAARSS
jgi:hypothetical protein